MPQCIACKFETFVQVGGVPICLVCLENLPIERPRTEREIRAVLVGRIIDASVQANAASKSFNEVTSEFPSGLPHPDGIQRIKNASNALFIARKEMATAHNRLNDFLSRGIVPEDLRRSG
jgi:hypothetical protein